MRIVGQRRLVLSSLFFFNSMWFPIYSVMHIDNRRIEQAGEEIKKDFEYNKKARVRALVSEAAMVFAVFASMYKWWKTAYSEADKRLVEVSHTMSGVPPALETVQRSVFERALASSKRFGVAVGDVAFPGLVSWLAQRVLGRFDEKLNEIYQERTISWFIQKRTNIDQMLANMQQIAFKIAPEPVLSNVLSVLSEVEDGAVCTNPMLQELWKLKIQAALGSTEMLDTQELSVYQMQLVAYVNQLIIDIERVIAFVRYRFPDDTYAEHVLIKQAEQLVNVLQEKLSNNALQGILSTILNFSQQYNHVVSHLSFAQKQPLQAGF